MKLSDTEIKEIRELKRRLKQDCWNDLDRIHFENRLRRLQGEINHE